MKTMALVSVEGDFLEFKSECFSASVPQTGQDKAKNREW